MELVEERHWEHRDRETSSFDDLKFLQFRELRALVGTTVYLAIEKYIPSDKQNAQAFKLGERAWGRLNGIIMSQTEVQKLNELVAERTPYYLEAFREHQCDIHSFLQSVDRYLRPRIADALRVTQDCEALPSRSMLTSKATNEVLTLWKRIEPFLKGVRIKDEEDL